MKTKIILWILAIMMVMPAPSYAQSDNSKKSSKKLEKAATIAGGALVGAAVLGSLFKKKKKDKQETETTEVQEAAYVAESTESVQETASNEEGVEVAVIGEELQRREGAFKLVTNHPDFKIKVRRCEASGKTCVIDLIIENVGSTDVTMLVSYHSSYMIAYDDEANQYTNMKLSLGSTEWINSGGSYRTLMAGIPVKARIQIEGVAESATMFRRLDWKMQCEAWGLNLSKPIKFINLPISREGDE